MYLDILTILENFEANSVLIEDRKRTMKFKWLHNAYESSHIDSDNITEHILKIHRDNGAKYDK